VSVLLGPRGLITVHPPTVWWPIDRQFGIAWMLTWMYLLYCSHGKMLYLKHSIQSSTFTVSTYSVWHKGTNIKQIIVVIDSLLLQSIVGPKDMSRSLSRTCIPAYSTPYHSPHLWRNLLDGKVQGHTGHGTTVTMNSTRPTTVHLKKGPKPKSIYY